mgnify:FL=1|tara:strand:- start:258 stop:515 length:258 start_codon:yes stop_codon:yes gene_type:complete
MTHIIESYLERTTKEKVVNGTGRKTCALDKKADKLIKHCRQCKRCWEPVCKPDSSKTQFLWYNDFPAYGKEIETCPTCQMKNKNN